jgi:hypothetical protein
MKLIRLLSRATALAVTASLLGLAFNLLPAVLFTAALASFSVLLFAHDYAAPVRRWQPGTAPRSAAASGRAVQPLRLAA